MPTPTTVPAVEEISPAVVQGKRVLSAEGRAKIAEAQKRRWDKAAKAAKAGKLTETSSRRARKPRSGGATSLAEREIDSRLASAIRERSEALQKVASLIHWQAKLKAVTEEINSLLSFQQRLHGGSDMHIGSVPDVPQFFTPEEDEPAPRQARRAVTPYNHMQPIPPGVTSVPAAKQPAPSNGNAADFVAGEGGFN